MSDDKSRPRTVAKTCITDNDNRTFPIIFHSGFDAAARRQLARKFNSIRVSSAIAFVPVPKRADIQEKVMEENFVTFLWSGRWKGTLHNGTRDFAMDLKT